MKKTLLLCSAILSMGGCTVAHPEASPQLTFANYTPINLNVQNPNLVESFKNKNDPKDISGQFVMPPSEAIKRYFENRFKGVGGADGQFTIDIKDSRVYLNEIEQSSKVLQWADIGKEDQYRVMVEIAVISQPSGFNGRQSTTIKMDRTLVMPSSVTLANRDMRQTKFLETFVLDLDKRINDVIDQTPAIRQ